MKDVNSCIFIGRLTRDADRKTTSGGSPLVLFSLAVNGTEKDGDAWKDRPSFLDFSWFGKGAEAVHQYLTKGQRVAVTAEAHQDRWADADGTNRNKIKFNVHGVQLLGGPKAGEKPAGDAQPAHEEAFQDDIPF